MAYIPTGIRSHSQKVCSLYKRILRNLESGYQDYLEYRYEAVLVRDEFDKNKNIKDLRIAKKLLIEGEKKLFNKLVYNEKKFAESPGGCAYERNPVKPDWMLDYWHPMEKAMYPKYFATREQRKKEYEEFFRKQYGELKKSDHH